MPMATLATINSSSVWDGCFETMETLRMPTLA